MLLFPNQGVQKEAVFHLVKGGVQYSNREIWMRRVSAAAVYWLINNYLKTSRDSFCYSIEAAQLH